MSGSSDRVRRRRWPLAVAAAAALAGAGWALGVWSDRTPEVRTVRPMMGDLEAAVVADGVLSYRSEVALTSEVLGAVASIEVAEGDRVERGDVLMRLDAERFRAQRAQREAGLQAERQALEARAAERERARVRHDRFRALRAQQLVSAEDLEQAALERRRTEAAYREIGFRVEAQRGLLAETMEQLRKTEIRSPIAGVILSIDIAPGETAVPSTLSFSGSTVARIADVSRLNATARLGEFDIWKLAPGAPARVVVPALNDAELKGTVRSVAMAPASAVPGQGGSLAAAYEVVVDIDGGAHSGLRTGMACRIEFPRGDGRARMTLPAEAVAPDRGDPAGRRGFVLVAEDGRLARRAVVLGASTGGRREIIGGLSAEARVVPPAAADRLRPGDRVRVRDDAAR
jgi:RND family efflux transporter MFP subunit